MPKYFTDERTLPFEVVRCTLDQISTDWVVDVFSRRDSASICISLPGLPDTSLGYILNIERHGDEFLVIDIKDKQLLTLSGHDEVVLMLNHVTGLQINDSIREKLLHVRDASS